MEPGSIIRGQQNRGSKLQKKAKKEFKLDLKDLPESLAVKAK
jgi:hypothetical protein